MIDFAARATLSCILCFYQGRMPDFLFFFAKKDAKWWARAGRASVRSCQLGREKARGDSKPLSFLFSFSSASDGSDAATRCTVSNCDTKCHQSETPAVFIGVKRSLKVMIREQRWKSSLSTWSCSKFGSCILKWTGSVWWSQLFAPASQFFAVSYDSSQVLPEPR